ncbi:DNA polymerase-3 subunit epsilon [Psychroflexus sp. MBR-150]|jgi:DNA polymerase-3 subunit epsilon
MLRFAPKFHEVAKRIVEITEDCIIVAHNAKFDYRILRTEFKRLGYDYQRQSLCTVELSKKLIPNMPSYSLGKLTKSLGIPIAGRHRAEGDAQATVKLLKLLLNKDRDKSTLKNYIRLKPKTQVDTKLLNFLDTLPQETGVYFFYDKDKKPLYVGKSKNIRKRVSQHFTKDNPKSKSIQRLTDDVQFDITGNELIALLKENEYIKTLQPEFNRALTKTQFTYGVYVNKDSEGYLNFKAKPIHNKSKALVTFSNLASAKRFLEQLVNSYELCLNKTSLGNHQKSCFNYGIKNCYGACLCKENADDYNARAKEIIDRYSFENKNFLLVTKGRELGEKSLVYIKNGDIVGFAYFNLNLQIQNIKILERILTPVKHQRDAKHIVQSYMRKHPNRLKMIDL